MKYLTPDIQSKYVCIVNYDSQDLAAVVSSHLSSSSGYLPVFLFPNITASEDKENDFEEDGFISRMIGSETSVLVNNALSRTNRVDYIIYAGLSAHQKSYLKFPPRIKIIEVNEMADVMHGLATITQVSAGELRCRKGELLKGLYVARKERKSLVMDESADPIEVGEYSSKGIVLVEDNKKASTVVAINYAVAIGADIKVVDGLPENEGRRIPRFFYEWKEDNDKSNLDKLESETQAKISGTDFKRYKFATFFTEGVPYSFFIRNEIPCSYVHLKLRSDLFVFNALVFEKMQQFHSAVLFSPKFFQVEEMETISQIISPQNFHSRALIGDDASVHNLDFYVQHYPYDVLHICTHGGEVPGMRVVEKYEDRNKQEHVVEYEEVAAFEIIPGSENIGVQRKVLTRRFDGYEWMSDELKAQKIPSYVFEDMRKALFYKDDLGANAIRTPIGNIRESCAIECAGKLFHQGTFRILASHHSPFIFNNSCWSWGEVSHFFLAGGARGYIGTLWGISLEEAVTGAEAFYKNLFGNTVLHAFSNALSSIRDTTDADIYVFWGLHFSTVTSASSVADSRHRVFSELIRAHGSWMRKATTTMSAEVKKNALEIARLIRLHTQQEFSPEDVRRLQQPTLKERIQSLISKRGL